MGFLQKQKGALHRSVLTLLFSGRNWALPSRHVRLSNGQQEWTPAEPQQHRKSTACFAQVPLNPPLTDHPRTVYTRVTPTHEPVTCTTHKQQHVIWMHDLYLTVKRSVKRGRLCSWNYLHLILMYKLLHIMCNFKVLSNSKIWFI